MHMDSCMRAYSTVQQLLCHGSYCELILSLARTSCRLLFTARPTARPLAGNLLRDAVRSRNPSKSTLAHDAVATAVLHKHHPIIRVGAGLRTSISVFYVNTARDVVTVLLIFAQYSSLYLHIFTCTYRGTHTQAHMYNQHTRGIETTRHRSLVERGGRKALLETLHTYTNDDDCFHYFKK